MTALAGGLLWPGRALSPLDGIPLNGVVEAVCIGLVVPALMWLYPAVVDRAWARSLIAGLIAVKLAGSVALPQHGLCARFSTAPLQGTIATIDINEPDGYLRSWDVRADWRAAAPRCTAIFDRAYDSREEFPVWFFNLLNALRPDVRDLALDVEGYVNVARAGTLALQIADDMRVEGRVGEAAIASGQQMITVPLTAGSHAVRLHARPDGSRWQFAPRWNGRDAFGAGVLTTSPASHWDSLIATPLAWLTTIIVAAIVIGWVVSAARAEIVTVPAVVWMLIASIILMAAGASARFDRFAPLLLAGAALVPLRRRQQTVRAAFLVIGVPWIALLAARAASQLGRVTFYSVGDDWHMFQSAGYAIVLNGQWFRGGSAIFLFQALYRWFAGGLHVIFGDPSPGDMFLDAACLLVAALACFLLVKPVSGFRAGLIAAALTLATFTISPIWHLIGRGLSEITAVGAMTLSLLCLFRARVGMLRAAAAGGLFAALMYLTRMDRALLVFFLPAALLPRRTPAAWDGLRRALGKVRLKPAFVYLLAAAPGLLLLATRTWWYTGHFSVIYGSSFAVQQTGLWPTTIASPAVWSNVVESFAGTLSMREPPALDPRTAIVVVGALVSALALVQVPWMNRLPAIPALLTCGSLAGALFAHTHEYAGRVSIHIVPFAVAMTVCTVTKLVHR